MIPRLRYLDQLGIAAGRLPEKEKILDDFRLAKQQAKNRLSSLQNRLKEQARFCKTALIQRVPRTITGILKVLDQHNIIADIQRSDNKKDATLFQLM